jgi:molecular chaperone HtpG
VSRETLQHDPRLVRIRTNLVNRVLKTLEDLKSSEYDAYVAFYQEFSHYLKEGAAQDWSNRERLADLLLFESTKTKAGEFTTLSKYVETMPAEQKEIYYLVGESRQLLENSPYLEAFKSRGREVLLLTEPIDEFLIGSMHEYKGKSLRAADRGEVETDKETEEKRKAAAERFGPLLEALKAKLAEEVKEVRLSARLKESAAVLVADEGAMSAHMERLMQRLGRGGDVKPAKRILELNPDHPAVQALEDLRQQKPDDPRVEAYGRLLYDQAVIAEGSRIKDPAAFAKRVNELIAGAAAAAK